MKKSGRMLIILMGITFSTPSFCGDNDEINRFHMLCKMDADVVVNGYEFKKTGLSFSTIAETIKKTFLNKSQTSKASGDDALYLMDMAYTLNPELNDEVIREAAYRLCMKEKLSTDRS